MNQVISDGKHMLSGVCEVTVSCGYDDEETADGILLTIDGKNYCAYSDPDDGYRSYGCFFETDKYVQKNNFPPQPVIVEHWHKEEYDEDCQWYQYDAKGIDIKDEDGNIIFTLGTDHSDAYYPVGFWHYYPENLPINK